MKQAMKILLGSLLLTIAVHAQADESHDVTEKIKAAKAGEHRDDVNRYRDQYRHPVETLNFFRLKDDMTVLEIWPGAGWYTEILAPVLRENGRLVVASYDVDIPDQPEYRYFLHDQLMDKFSAEFTIYDRVQVAKYSEPGIQQLGQPDSVDMVLTFRNMHGWISDDVMDEVLADFHAVIKPGGLLGVVQHRAASDADAEQTVPNGYVPEATVIELVEAAGFTLLERSEINANPKDTRDHPEGVWTLPPSLRLGKEDKDKYLAIGESDRMTLLFQKN